jgi:GTPase
MHKSGFVNIIGNPNVGKSTLMNKMVGEKLSIITPKSQTTRHRILGILNGDEFQIVFSDTPGLIKPHYKLQEAMVKAALSAFEDADIVLYVTDINETIDKNEEYLEKLRNCNIPILLLINKIDLSKQEKVLGLINQWKEIIPKAEIFAVSALKQFNLEGILSRILELLPENPPYYGKEDLTDRSTRFFISEMIREKILLYFEKEIPYSVEVEIEEYIEEINLVKIRGVIYVMRDSQKGIIIGHKGEALKRIGTQARKDMEEFIGKKVFLELYVKIDKEWRDNERKLKRFGYLK